MKDKHPLSISVIYVKILKHFLKPAGGNSSNFHFAKTKFGHNVVGCINNKAITPELFLVHYDPLWFMARDHEFFSNTGTTPVSTPRCG
jgi:hypothetical protein